MSALSRKLLALSRSRAIGFVLLAALVFSVITLARNWLVSARAPAPGPSLMAIPEMTPERLDVASRRHVQAARQRCEALWAEPGASPRQQASAYGEMGKIYLAYDQEGPATACFVNALAFEPEEFRWWYLLAHARDRAGQTAPAAEAMARALKAMPHDVTATAVDQHAGLCFLGDRAMRLNQTADAQQTFEAAIQIHPQSSFALVKLGQLASQKSDSDKAIAYYQRALAIMPNRAEIRMLLAAEYRQKGDATKAAEWAVHGDTNLRQQPLDFGDPLYESVVELNRSGARYNRLGIKQMEIGRYKLAAEHLRLAIQADPEKALYRRNYGQCLVNLGEMAEGIKVLEDAAKRAPDDESVRRLVCSAYAKQPATAPKAVERALAYCKEKPGDVGRIQLLADIYVEMDRFEDALKVFAQAAKLDPRVSWPPLGQARMLATLGRSAEARDMLEATLKLFSDDGDVRMMLARLLVACPEAKIRDGARGLKMSQELYAAWANINRTDLLAVALAENGRFIEAINIQRQAVALCEYAGGPRLRWRLERVLHTLEAKQPYREPWPFCEVESAWKKDLPTKSKAAQRPMDGNQAKTQ
jgi:predicted Zn-dependent protease